MKEFPAYKQLTETQLHAMLGKCKNEDYFLESAKAYLDQTGIVYETLDEIKSYLNDIDLNDFIIQMGVNSCKIVEDIDENIGDSIQRLYYAMDMQREHFNGMLDWSGMSEEDVATLFLNLLAYSYIGC